MTVILPAQNLYRFTELFVPRHRRSMFGRRAFSVSGPAACNSLPDYLSHKTDGRLPLLSARPAVTLATLKSAATNFGVW